MTIGIVTEITREINKYYFTRLYLKSVVECRFVLHNYVPKSIIIHKI